MKDALTELADLRAALAKANDEIAILRADLRAETDAKMVYAGEVTRLQLEVARIRDRLRDLLATVML